MIEIEQIDQITAQAELSAAHGMHGIRLDVLVRDSSGYDKLIGVAEMNSSVCVDEDITYDDVEQISKGRNKLQ